MEPLLDPNLEKYAVTLSTDEPELLRELEAETHDKMPYPEMVSGKLSGRFLRLLVELTGAKNVIEVGMFTGYSALCMAEGLPKDGQLTTCEIDQECIDFAKRYFDRSPHGSKIRVLQGPALESLKDCGSGFHLAFIDADKENYGNYFEALVPKMARGAIMVFDNCLWSGRVLDPKSESDKGVDALNRLVDADKRVENIILTIRDGLNLVRVL